MASKLAERINLSASLVTILQAVGLWELILGLVFGLAQAWISWMLDAPLWLIPPTFLFVLGTTIWIFNQVSIARKIRAESKPDYKEWDGFGEFNVWDAACLWDDKPLNSAWLTDRGLSIMRRIKLAISDGKINVKEMNGQSANRKTVVTREQLRALAGMWGDRPRFLFPEVR
jgi:hypothetical protein